MAKFDRELLISYLENLCALYFLKDKLERRYSTLYSKISAVQHGEPLLNTRKRTRDSDGDGCGLALTGIPAILLLIFGIKTIPSVGVERGAGFGAVFFFVLSIVCFVLFITHTSGINRENEEIEKEYELTLAENEEIKARNLENQRKYLPTLQNELAMCEKEIGTVSALISKAYTANIIPSYYRDKYTAVYLYDYFSTGSSNDMDMALSMFVLEQIKSRLDTIIAQQSEMLLNQRLMLANQQKSLENQRAYAARMEAKVNRLTRIEEERNQYLRMIECNTSATAYFAAADYIKNI